MKRFAVFYDNAMLYKDLTQWMRNKTFLTLFIGLLSISEVVAFIVATVPTDSTQLGLIMFSILCGLLVIYGIAILGMAGALTSREFHDKTFELYEMSGMSLEKMVSGKILSMLYQFAFGYFCIVPFMFFAYLLGGLDFATIFLVSITVAILVVPVYLMGLLFSLLTKFRRISGLGRGLGIAALIFFVVPWVFQILFSSFLFRRSRSPFRFLTGLFTFDLDGVIHLAVALVFLALICLLLFYLCCNAIARSTDSREPQVKAILLSLMLFWIIVVSNASSPFSNPEGFYLLFVPLGLLFLLASMMFHYNRMDVPIMIRKKQETGSLPQRRFYGAFRPDARGGFRWVVFLFLIALVCGLWIWLTGQGDPNYERNSQHFFRSWSLVLQVPWFLAIPGAALLVWRKMRNRIAQVRTISFLWWALAGALVSIVHAMLGEYRMRADIQGYRNLVEFLGIFISPAPSLLAGMNDRSEFFAMAPTVRIASGVIGIYLLHVFLRGRAAMEAIPVKINIQKPETDASWKNPESNILAADKLRDTP